MRNGLGPNLDSIAESTTVTITQGVLFGFSSGFTVIPNTDADADGINDVNDNCPNTANPSQSNIDNDTQGDACDADDDNDSVLDTDDAFPTESIVSSRSG